MTAICDPEETRAVALTGMCLSFALAGILKRMGALSPEAVTDALEAALSSVETAFPAADRSAAMARQFLDLMGEQLASHVKPLSSPPPSVEGRVAAGSWTRCAGDPLGSQSR
jgi:hypothetical protein